MMKLSKIIAIALVGATAWVGPATAEAISIVSFNTESDADTVPRMVARDMTQIRGIDIWGLSEVAGFDAVQRFVGAARTAGNSQYRFILSRTGGGDRLAIIYDSRKFDLLETSELDEVRYRPDGSLSSNMRGQLAARFRLQGSTTEFIFAVNHLKCCGNGVGFRLGQISTIKEWANRQNVPAIVVGDFNTPVSPDQAQEMSPGFRALIDGNTFEWVAPPLAERVPTQCHPNFMSMLDFVFVSGVAKNWQNSAQILYTEPDYCVREVGGTSDHRPVKAVFEIE